jgi:hypothetical protein
MTSEVTLEQASFIFSQEQDSCASGFGNDITISTADAGGGKYLVIETSRWTVGADEIDAFADLLRSVLEKAGA